MLLNHFRLTRVFRNTAGFIKKSLLFSLLSTTLLYIVVRIFFYEFPFTAIEAIELYTRVLLVIWTFLVSCKLFFSGLVLAENYMNKHSRVIVAEALEYAHKTVVAVENKAIDPLKISNDEPAIDSMCNFFVELS